MSASEAIAKAFVRDTPLPPTTKSIGSLDGTPLAFDSAKAQAMVVGPQILSFVRGVTAERREMVATSSLFASLAADATGATRESAAWYNAYLSGLTKLGWTLVDTQVRTFAQEHQGAQVHEAVIEFLGALGVGGPALVLVTGALKAMQKVGDDQPWITLFDRQTRTEKVAGFQIGLVEEEEESVFVVKLTRFALKLAQTRTQVLFASFDTLGVSMDSTGSRVTVAEEIVRAAMPALKERLSAFVRSSVSEIKLPEPA